MWHFKKNHRIHSSYVIDRDWGGPGECWIKPNKLSVTKWASFAELRDSMVMIVNNTYFIVYLRLLKKADLFKWLFRKMIYLKELHTQRENASLSPAGSLPRWPNGQDSLLCSHVGGGWWGRPSTRASPTAFLGHWQGVGLEGELLWYELVLRRDVSIVLCKTKYYY